MQTFEIKSRWDGRVLYSAEGKTLRDVVARAVLGGAYLGDANLGDADLRGANLRGANLRGADLRGAYLGGADLRGADLRGAYLGGADLGDADLRGAYLEGAYLRGKGRNKLTLRGARPILMLGPLGSRGDYLAAYTTDGGVYVRAGCFFATLDKFRAAITETHGDSNYGREYAAAIAMIEAHSAVWAEPAVAEAA